MRPLVAAMGLARVFVLIAIPVTAALLTNGLGRDLSAAQRNIGKADTRVMVAGAHDVGLSDCVASGLGPVGLSDTNGAVSLVTCKSVNLSDHDEAVVITAPADLLTTPLPEGCTATANLVIPGRTDFVLLTGEQKLLLYRVRFECHAPAVESIVPIAVETSIEHVVQPDGLGDGNPGNNSATLIDTMIIGQATPAPTPSPTPSSVLDSDGDGYTDSAEAHIGTQPDKPCGDGWPANVINGGLSFNKLDLEDLSSFLAPVRRLNTSPGDTNFDVRWDLVPGATVGDAINIQDMVALSPSSSSAMAYPPMFGGGQAFGRTCPWPP